MSKLNVFISGQKMFGGEILRYCLSNNINVVGVCCPVGDKYVGGLAAFHGIPIINAGTLSADNMPDGVDLGITAHSFDYIGKKTRYAAKYGWIGYHPSLLPRHRGKSSIEWAIRMGDAITGGTVYWLNAGIDRGDVLSNGWCFIDPKLRTMSPANAARELWRRELFDMGVELLTEAVSEISRGVIRKSPQDERFATFEPSTEVAGIYKPDLLMIGDADG